MEGTKLAEGKTKVIRAIEGSDEVLIESKDDITAGDGARKHSFPDKGAISTATAVNCFRLLEGKGIRTHFVAQVAPNVFRARRCVMIPIEIVTRRLAAGSYLKRHPDVAEGARFDEPPVEFYLKDDARHDPLMLLDEATSTWMLHDAKAPAGSPPIGTRPLYAQLFGHWSLDRIFIDRLRAIARSAFLAFEEAWAKQGVTLVDLKIECGVDPETYALLVADVIDNDAWRIWPGGDKAKMLDKQVYRNLADVTPEALEAVAANYAQVAAATERFLVP
ncbi:MAG TPA: phosphoribosylaminoimidazolesuccinocarboxamide synthase [Candidatus Binatia bacterium]|jgi:phosphoribosylaminoimidazole-succinocarboxamide synthase|nr:phosphoribosylaminoimidazolesuccinocarboxamide synthase [Candidatus Binatia bacterium]